MSAADRGEIAAILDAQYDDYQAMLALGVQQENSFSRNDLSDLDDNFQQLRLCMNRIRLRETQLPTSAADHRRIGSDPPGQRTVGPRPDATDQA
jgi:hypothetical protein